MKNITQGAKEQTNRKEEGKENIQGKKVKVSEYQTSNKDLKEQTTEGMND